MLYPLPDYAVSVESATEGDDVVVTVTSTTDQWYYAWFENMSATSGDDFSDPTDYEWYTFEAGPDNDHEIHIPTIDDSYGEGTESFKIHVGSWVTEIGDNWGSFFDAVVEADIYDNDAAFTATIVSATEGNDLFLEVTNNLDQRYPESRYRDLQIQYYLSDGSAAVGDDYYDPLQYGVAYDGTFFYAIDDSLAENTESFHLHLKVQDHDETAVDLEADIFDNDPHILTHVTYAYDAFNRLVHREATTHPLDVTADGTYANQYFSWRNGQIALQFDGSTASDLSHRYLWGPNVDQLLADEAIGGDVVWPLEDHLGSTNDLATYDAGTGETTIAAHRQFDSYGNLLSPSAVDELFGYTGKPFDAATGLQYNVNRWYDPKVGRWLSEDPTGLGPDTNPFRYVGNSPTNATDPSGLITREQQGKTTVGTSPLEFEIHWKFKLEKDSSTIPQAQIAILQRIEVSVKLDGGIEGSVSYWEQVARLGKASAVPGAIVPLGDTVDVWKAKLTGLPPGCKSATLTMRGKLYVVRLTDALQSRIDNGWKDSEFNLSKELKDLKWSSGGWPAIHSSGYSSPNNALEMESSEKEVKVVWDGKKNTVTTK